MNYNFDEIIDRRHTNALNTDGFRGYIFHAGPEKVFAFKDEEFVRMWVADMEFAFSDTPACTTTNTTTLSQIGARITMTCTFPKNSSVSHRELFLHCIS